LPEALVVWMFWAMWMRMGDFPGIFLDASSEVGANNLWKWLWLFTTVLGRLRWKCL